MSIANLGVGVLGLRKVAETATEPPGVKFAKELSVVK